MRADLDDLIESWPYETVAGDPVAREVRARDGRKILQVRVELGVLQLEVIGRPDGERPHGFITYLDYLRHGAGHRTTALDSETSRWSMSGKECTELDREVAQFYHRRIAWRALGRHERVILDADHTLAMMDFVREHGISAQFIAAHEQCRGTVLFHRTEAAFALGVERRQPELAIEALHRGIDRLTTYHHDWWEANDDAQKSPVPKLVERLRKFEDQIRKEFAVKKSLKEQLDEAVAREDYENAAVIRDAIKAQERR